MISKMCYCNTGKIISQPVTAIAEHLPDSGHMIKDTNNEFSTLEPLLKGKHPLLNKRIKGIHTDIHAPMIEYSSFIGWQSEKEKCLNQMPLFDIIVMIIQNAFKKSTVLIAGSVQEEAANNTLNHRGKTMDLSEKAILSLEAIIMKWFNWKSIDQISKCKCSNSSEEFLGL